MTVLPLFLSDVGGSEIVLILLVILMFFGSKSIPGIARTMGKTMHQIRQASQDVQNEIKKSAGDVKTDFDLQKMVRETTDIIEKPLLEESVKMDQIIQTPTQFSKPFGMPNPSSPAVDVPDENPTLDQPVEEPKKDLAQE
ncbi:twin-arginine translocase TatA/TatE family subunit [uncultured Fluviicola sp.]|uniref:twin-arginine translocase TatA/TatE family subunit n=1 Tax=uncultured Fluviicola sp. TaxID=463303 RepID=UPI0025F2E609|nr:twin-arginine translocase TatA/TatE family subunit [uncultured Fluviicola sp.]